MSEWKDKPKLYGTVTKIQVEQLCQEAALVFAVKSPATEEKQEETKTFVNPFHGDPLTSAQLDLLRDAMASNRTVRIVYDESDGHPLRMLAVRVHAGSLV